MAIRLRVYDVALRGRITGLTLSDAAYVHLTDHRENDVTRQVELVADIYASIEAYQSRQEPLEQGRTFVLTGANALRYRVASRNAAYVGLKDQYFPDATDV